MASLSIREVLWTESARKKAGARGIVEDDVEDAIRRQPLVREQKSRLVQSNEGVWRVRPTRVLESAARAKEKYLQWSSSCRMSKAAQLR